MAENLNKRDIKLKEKAKEAIQRSYHMFMSEVGKRIEEDELILKKKIELKTEKNFNSLNNQ